MNLDALLQRPDIWRGDQLSAAVKAVPSGFAELDAQLAGGGWPQGALTELIMPRQGIGALRLLMPALAQLSQDDRWICWVAPPHIPYAPALANAGIDFVARITGTPKGAAGRSVGAGTKPAFRELQCRPCLADPGGQRHPAAFATGRRSR